MTRRGQDDKERPEMTKEEEGKPGRTRENETPLCHADPPVMLNSFCHPTPPLCHSELALSLEGRSEESAFKGGPGNAKKEDKVGDQEDKKAPGECQTKARENDGVAGGPGGSP